MKLKADFITQNIEDVQFMVSVGARSFDGVVRNNETAAFIVDALKEETTEKKIVDLLCAEYDVDRETAAKDVAGIIEKLRGINALEE